MKQELINKLTKLPSLIEKEQLELIKLINKKDELNEEIEFHESVSMKEISEVVDDKGKLKFSNETSRKAELTIRLFEDKLFRESKFKLKSTLNEIEEKKVMIELLKNEFSSLKYIVKLLTNGGENNE